MKPIPKITMEYLNKLDDKNEYSGFDRTDSVKIIRALIKELKRLIATHGQN